VRSSPVCTPWRAHCSAARWSGFGAAATPSFYKLYALEASVQQYPYLPFLLISIPARLIRFVLVTLLVGGIRKLLGEHLSLKGARWTLVICWTAFYTAYFLYFP
jgi:hypothetical protein